jgi:hypothetical protein
LERSLYHLGEYPFQKELKGLLADYDLRTSAPMLPTLVHYQTALSFYKLPLPRRKLAYF